MFQQEGHSVSVSSPAVSPRHSPALSSPLSYGTPLSTPSHTPEPSPRLSEAGPPFQPAPFVPQPRASPSQLQGGPGPGLDQGHSQQPEVVISPVLEDVPSQPRGDPGLSQGSSQEEVETQVPTADSLPDMAVILQTFKPTITYVPAPVATEWSRVLGSLADRLARDPSDVGAWKCLFMVSFCIFPSFRPDKRMRRTDGDLTLVQKIRRRLSRWRNGEQRELWEEAMQLTKMARTSKRRQLSDEELLDMNTRRAAKHAAEGELSKAAEALTSAGLAPPSAENLAKMEALHPTSDPPAAQVTDTAQLRVSAAEVMKAVSSMRPGSAPGSDAMKPSHLKAALGPNARGRKDATLAAVTRFVNVCLAGEVPTEVRPYFCSAVLHAVPKRDGNIRPIAVGLLLRRITAKSAVKKVMGKLTQLFSPHQLGCGVRNGCESIIHATKLILASHPDRHVLQADYINAYNNIDRSYMLEEVKAQVPELLNFTMTCYGNATDLYYGDHVLKSSTGLGQGDPLACALYCLTVMPVITEIDTRVPDLDLNEWLMDDSTIVGKTEDVKLAIEVMEEMGPPRGMFLSTDLTVPNGRGKSTVFSLHSDHDTASEPFGHGVKTISDTGIRLLGSPLGSADFVQRFLNEATDKIEETINQLHRLQDSQTSLLIIRSCLSLYSKFSYLIRTVDMTDYTAVQKKFDDIQRNAVNSLLGGVMDSAAYQQSVLPTSLGGLGVKRCQDHSASAYAASISASLNLILRMIKREDFAGAEDGSEVNIEGGAEDNIEEKVARSLLSDRLLAVLSDHVGEEVRVDTILAGVTQKDLSRKIDVKLHKSLLEKLEGSDRETARLAALSLPNTSGYLNCIPNRRLGHHMRSHEFTVVIKYRLGMKLFPEDSKCPACHHILDPHGDHLLHCSHGGLGILRHNVICGQIFRLCQEGGLGPAREVPFLLNNGRRPADIYVPFLNAGKPVAIDFTCISQLRSDFWRKEADHAVKFAHERKERSVGAELRREGVSFWPVAVSSLGIFHPEAVKLIQTLCRYKSVRLGLDEKKTFNQEMKVLSTLLQRGNSLMFTSKNIEFIDEQAFNSDNSELNVIEQNH